MLFQCGTIPCSGLCRHYFHLLPQLSAVHVHTYNMAHASTMDNMAKPECFLDSASIDDWDHSPPGTDLSNGLTAVKKSFEPQPMMQRLQSGASIAAVLAGKCPQPSLWLTWTFLIWLGSWSMVIQKVVQIYPMCVDPKSLQLQQGNWSSVISPSLTVRGCRTVRWAESGYLVPGIKIFVLFEMCLVLMVILISVWISASGVQEDADSTDLF